MSTVSITPILGVTQIWQDFNGIDVNKEDKEEDAHRTSLYVDVFQKVHDIVMEREKFLFSSEELACFQKLNTMSYAARYLVIRLCLRKRGKWHSVSDLEKRYKIEIGGKARISEIIDELCSIARDNVVKVKDEEPDIIDLTQDEDEDSGRSFPSRLPDQSDHTNGRESAIRSITQNDFGDEGCVIAEDDAHATLPELLSCLAHEELKNIGKQLKVTRTGQTRSTLSDAIVAHASSQTTLAFPVLTPRNKTANANKGTGKSMLQSNLTLPKDTGMKTGTALVRRLILKLIGRCIRISLSVFALFDRLSIIFFRSTNHSSPLLLPALLTAFRKRRHADTRYVRSIDVFPSRQSLLEYEEYLVLEARIDEAFSGQIQAAAHPSSKKPQGKGKAKQKDPPLTISRRVEGAQVVRNIWTDIFERWKSLVSCSKDEERSPSLERFDSGHVLTRIVSKGAEALGILKEHALEIEVLEALLAQTKWRRGHRGAWYDRLALVLMTHSEKTQETLEKAMDVVIDGLRDSWTHLIYRPRLERRLTRLEKMLNVPMSERHTCDGQLQHPPEVYIEGVRVRKRISSVIQDKSGRINGTNPFLTGRSKSLTPSTMFWSSTQALEDNENIEQSSQPWKGKTLWLAKQGEEVSVEQFALEYYYELGFKGFHSEGRIVSTIFGLLFWDVIFASVPGAFETPFQSAPLDIFEDAFYSARRELIDQRLTALENGDAHRLLEQVLERERPYRTSCIGIDWEFEPNDLLEIVDCLGGHALAIICRILCEKYGQWQGGVPDLLVWNIDTRECRFVEVKSPNDRLQENQKVWIDILIGSETLVDLCHVVEKGEKENKPKGSRVGSRGRTRMKNPDTSSDANSVESELDDDADREQQIFVKIQDRNSDDFVHSLTKKRKNEVTEMIPRNARKRSCV